jgi:uncharacterized protein YceH (UPF0502 family)
VDEVGSRVHNYRHTATEGLHARTAELAILAELLMRGPQTLGELRGRASRMYPLESIDRVKEMIRALSDRPEPYVKEIPPSPGSRAERYVQLLCVGLHQFDESAAEPATPAPATGGLASRVAELEDEMRSLREFVAKLATAVGEETMAREIQMAKDGQ